MLNQTAILYMTPLAFVVSCLLVMWIRRYIAHMHEQAQQPGLTMIRQLGLMLSQIHTHRDLCTIWPENEAMDAVKIDLLQKDVAASINKIVGAAASMSRDDRWMGMVEHWGRLSVHYHHLAPESCLSQHNRMLSNLLRVIEERAAYLEFDELMAEIAVLDKSWDSLLSLSDDIHQAHALGQHAFASGDALSAQKLRLNYIQRNMRNILEPGHLSPVIESSLRQPMEAFIACIEELKVEESPPIATTPYFRLAKEVMDAVNSQFEEQVKRLQQAIALLAEESWR